jgi:lysozyme
MPVMKTSAAGRQLIECFEGLFLRTYDDGEGVLTIGYGHTSAAGGLVVSRGMAITVSKADEILTDDLHPCELRVVRLINASLNQNEFDALVSFEFNTGDLGKSSIPAKINAGRKADAMDTLSRYVHGANTGKLYPGLVRRRKAERLMFEGDVAGALKLAGAHYGGPDVPSRKADTAPVGAGPPARSNTSPSPPPKRSLLAAFLSAVLAIWEGKST